MEFLFGCLVLIIIAVSAFRRNRIKTPYSKGMGIAIALSILVVISLAQNYTQSLIPEANDGIGISNQLAYWIIGENGWSQDSFRNIFEKSIYFSLILIAVYPIVLVTESKLERKSE